jgi:hypothetical protein
LYVVTLSNKNYATKRVKDIEREDAIDILALLVERSVEFHEKMEQKPENTESDEKKENTNNNNNSEKSSIEVQKCVAFFQNKSKENTEIGPYDHDTRMKILDELEQSHIYAAEMKRAALSALTWLRSVRRSPSSPTDNLTADKSNTHQRMPSDPTILKTLAHSYQEQLREKDDLNKRLDLELSFCRAEIGRLKSVKRNEVSLTMEIFVTSFKVFHHF